MRILTIIESPHRVIELVLEPARPNTFAVVLVIDFSAKFIEQFGERVLRYCY